MPPLRPIKPEDEPMWHELLASCSEESIRFRFRYLFKQTTHEMATRFCFHRLRPRNRHRRRDRRDRLDESSSALGAWWPTWTTGRRIRDVSSRTATRVTVSGSLLTDDCLEICSAGYRYAELCRRCKPPHAQHL